MASINIDRRSDDPFNRYQMPKLLLQNQGGKCILANLADIGQALHREPLYIAKFFSYEFGVPVRMDSKTNLFIISGQQNRDSLQNALHKFIECFVLCSNCDNPETELTVRHRKSDELRKVCAACGHTSPDNMASHRLAVFIIKNFPETPTAKTTNVLFKDRSVISQEAIHEDNDDMDDLSQYHSLTVLIEGKKNRSMDDDVVKEIINHVEQANLMEKASFILARILFTENIIKEIDEYKLLFQQLCQTNLQGQEYLLHALEILIKEQKSLRRQSMIVEIFSKLHQNQIIDGQTFVHWYENPRKSSTNKSTSKKIRQVTKEFIKQFNPIDEESDSSLE